MLKWDPRVRRGRILLRATLSPGGLLAAGILAVVGLVTGISVPWIVAAGLVAWGTSTVLRLRDPALVSSLVAPQFDRDLGALRGEERVLMVAGLQARDRLEQAAHEVPGDEFSGLRVRVDAALERMYDSLVWSQRASEFLAATDVEEMRRRMLAEPRSSPIAEELSAQIDEVSDVDRQRQEVLGRCSATVTGIETLAVKMGSLALDLTAPGVAGHTEEVRSMRRDLDSHVAGLEEIESHLGTLPPQPSV